MRSDSMRRLMAAAILLGACAAGGRAGKPAAQCFPLDSLRGLEMHNIKGEVAEYRGRRAVRLVQDANTNAIVSMNMAESIAILDGTDFQNGTIEAELAGMPAAGSPADSRGFLGVAFRVAGHGEKFECFYLRPTNGRADDQLRRNHALQYISYPDFPWYKLRKENPGQYESYADMGSGEWTRIRIEVQGVKARLYVNGAAQPALIVNDLKLGESHGKIALWTTTDTDGYFSNLTVKE